MGAVRRPSWRDEKGQEVILKGREESGVSPSVPRGSQKALLVGREGLVGPPGWPGGVKRDGRGQESPQEDWEDREAFMEGREGSGGPPSRTGGMERGWEAHPDGRVVWKPSQQGREESGVPKGGQEGS